MAEDNPVVGTAYDEEFEKDFTRILANEHLELQSLETLGLFVSATTLKHLMRQAWQFGWSTGFGWQEKIEEQATGAREPD